MHRPKIVLCMQILLLFCLLYTSSAVLEVVGTLKEKFKAEYIVNMLVGNETSEIQSYKHNELEIFGSGSDEEEKTWNAVIRQALIAGYLAKDIENYGLLKITEKGKEFIKKPVSFRCV